MRKQLQLFVVFFNIIALLASFNATAGVAEIQRNDPEQLLKQATSEMLKLSRDARDYAKQNPQRYYCRASAILDQVIDKSYFARGVMATYASARLYRSLKTDAEREAFKARVHKFADSLEEVLIEKYADALLAFNGERIDVENITASDGAKGRASLLQTIYDQDNTTYRVQYNLQQQKDGNWLINNLVVEGINLGATYRNQFAEAVEKHRGDVDYVVDHWQEIMSQEKAKEQKSQEQKTQAGKAGKDAGVQTGDNSGGDANGQ